MIVLGNRFNNLILRHALQADGVGQTVAAFTRLPAARRAQLMQVFIYPLNGATRQQIIEKSFDGLPTESPLDERPSLVGDVIGGDEPPAFLLGALKSGKGGGMKRVGAVKAGVKTRRVH